jgi:pimeloyl-ACP methyl ester carboxylesterase
MFLWLSVLTLAHASPVIAANAVVNDSNRVVLVHGLGRSSLSLWLLEKRLRDAGFEVVTLDYASLTQGVDAALAQVQTQMQHCCADNQPLHFVAYSLGGLMVRGFLANPNNAAFLQRLDHVVMIGTPNHGTAAVEAVAGQVWFKLLGETTASLGHAEMSFANQLPPPQFAVGIIAGNSSWGMADAILAEPSDGLVPVSSTKLANMKDFLLVNANHSMLRYNTIAAQETIYFLRHGVFSHQYD